MLSLVPPADWVADTNKTVVQGTPAAAVSAMPIATDVVDVYRRVKAAKDELLLLSAAPANAQPAVVVEMAAVGASDAAATAASPLVAKPTAADEAAAVHKVATNGSNMLVPSTLRANLGPASVPVVVVAELAPTTAVTIRVKKLPPTWSWSS